MTTTVAMTKPVVTQVISSTVEPSAPRRCGVATATIDVSIAPISVPKVTDSVTSHLFTGGRSGTLWGTLCTALPGALRGATLMFLLPARRTSTSGPRR